ncbi:MAG: AAA family ATPase [Pseudomonadota bacterium]
MRLIDSIEISYFRSVYSAKLKDVGDLNILVGSNDCGKSNVLRALNLFFNGNPSPNEQFDFLEDVSHIRQDEAREAKGRLTIWIKITFNNIEKWRTLPEKFTIKRVWNRYSDTSEISFDVDTRPANITKFLNKIDFHYVPAVKHTSTYSFYLRKLYETISQDPEFDLIAPSEELSRSINQAVSELSNQVENTIGIKSQINIPTDFGTLFERLNFETMNGEHRIPLTKRGDGIQSRHIPHILEHISENNKKLNIWGYEEPENSLELANSFDLAGQFRNTFSKNNQVFVTSHSPAFYGINDENTKKYYIRKINENGRRSISSISKFESNTAPDESLGIAALIADRSRSLYLELEEKNRKLQNFQMFLDQF